MLGRKLNIFLQWNKFLNDFVGLNYLKNQCRLRTLKRNIFQFWKKKIVIPMCTHIEQSDIPDAQILPLIFFLI